MTRLRPAATDLPGQPASVFTNNIVDHNTYGVFGRNASGHRQSGLDEYFIDAGHASKKRPRDDTATATATLHRRARRSHASPPRVNIGRRRGTRSASSTRPAITTASRPRALYNNAGTDGADVGANIDLIELATAARSAGTGPPTSPGDGARRCIVNFDRTNTPITLGASGTDTAVTKNGTDAELPRRRPRSSPGGTPGDDILSSTAPPRAADLQQRQRRPTQLEVLNGTHNVPADLATPIRNVPRHRQRRRDASISPRRSALGSLTVNGKANLTRAGAR